MKNNNLNSVVSILNDLFNMPFLHTLAMVSATSNEVKG